MTKECDAKPAQNRRNRDSQPGPAAVAAYSAAARPALAATACQIFCGVAGMFMCVTPRGASASTTAFITAASAPTVPASPHPLTPSGLVRQGISFILRLNEGMSSARGMA